MAKIKLIDDQLDDIVVKHLKKDYKLNSLNIGDDEVKYAIGVLLRYYMYAPDADAWIAKQREKQ